MDDKAAEAAESRLWSGIHFRSDITVGLDSGRKVGDLVIAQAAADGSSHQLQCWLSKPSIWSSVEFEITRFYPAFTRLEPESSLLRVGS